jgi:hypothetical protein
VLAQQWIPSPTTITHFCEVVAEVVVAVEEALEAMGVEV